MATFAEVSDKKNSLERGSRHPPVEGDLINTALYLANGAMM